MINKNILINFIYNCFFQLKEKNADLNEIVVIFFYIISLNFNILLYINDKNTLHLLAKTKFKKFYIIIFFIH